MKKIFQIFFHDIKQILKNVVAIVVVIGLVCLPCIYCWMNLLSSWSPYSDLSGIKVGVYSEDQGVYIGDVYINIGDAIVESLHENDTIGWVFYNDDMPEDADKQTLEKQGDDVVSGVYDGDTYAAFVIPSDFSEKLVGFITGDLEHPTMEYYENQKKNAIVPKITSKVKTTVQEQVNESIISGVSETLMASSNYLAGKGGTVTSATMETLQSLDEDLGTYISILNSFIYITQSAETIMSSSQDLLPDLESIVENGQDSIATMENMLVNGNLTLSEASATLDAAIYSLELQMLRLQNQVNTDTGTMESVAATIKSDAAIIQTNLTMLSALLDNIKYMDNQSVSKKIEDILQIEDIVSERKESRYQEMQDSITNINNDLTDITEVADATAEDTQALKQTLADKINSCIQDFETMKTIYNGSLKTSLQTTNAALYSSLLKATSVLENVDVDFDAVSDSLTSYADILNSGTASLTDSLNMAQELKGKLDEMITYLENLQMNDDYQKLADMLENNPQKFADFISEPTEVTEIALFEISDEQGNSYASAMSSFYSVLALYLSSLFCMVIMHAKVKRKNYSEITGKISRLQAYFGRWLTFACVSVITSTILALGDLLFIEVQCKHPLEFVVSMIVIGLVFNFFAYSCAFGLGLLGESFALLCMIVSVCCSSSFPMELLPWIFGKMNHFNLIIFQPGMNMLKETIGGYNAMDYWIYVLQLFAYVFAAMLIALGIGRIPFVKWFTELLEKRKNDSHVML